MAHLNSRLLWQRYAAGYYHSGDKVLEIGPAGSPTYYEKALAEKAVDVRYECLDIRSDFISGAEARPGFILSDDPLHYPIADNAYDVVFSDQVLAHVEFFWLWYAELLRITKPGGYIITINSYSYPQCPSPIDGWRVSSDGMEALNKASGVITLLSKTASAEMEDYKIGQKPGHYFPGASITDPFGPSPQTLRLNKIKRNWNNVVGKIPKLRSLLLNPVQVAFDTITIAQKPLT